MILFRTAFDKFVGHLKLHFSLPVDYFIYIASCLEFCKAEGQLINVSINKNKYNKLPKEFKTYMTLLVSNPIIQLSQFFSLFSFSLLEDFFFLQSHVQRFK